MQIIYAINLVPHNQQFDFIFSSKPFLQLVLIEKHFPYLVVRQKACTIMVSSSVPQAFVVYQSTSKIIENTVIFRQKCIGIYQNH